MTGISVDLEAMARAIAEFSGLADAVRTAISDIQGRIDKLPYGGEIVSQAFSALYTFATAWFEEALKTHAESLQYAADSVNDWATKVTQTDKDLTDAFHGFMTAIQNGG